MANKGVLAQINYDYSVDASKLPVPVKLTPEDMKPLEITVAGRAFYTFHALICPKCGVVSGINTRKDLDHQVGFFLMFGCNHYEGGVDPEVETESEAPVEEPVNVVE